MRGSLERFWKRLLLVVAPAVGVEPTTRGSGVSKHRPRRRQLEGASFSGWASRPNINRPLSSKVWATCGPPFDRREFYHFGLTAAHVVITHFVRRLQDSRSGNPALEYAGVEEIRCHCNSCGHPTKHDMIATRSVDEVIDEDSRYTLTEIYDTLQCRGCESVTLRYRFVDPAHGEEISFYPPRVSRRAPDWRWDLPAELRSLLEEIYIALHSDCRRLALMGTRTLVDQLMTREVGDLGSFQEKLDALYSKGLIGQRGRDVLSAALDAGSAAAHRGYQPKSTDLSSIMDVVENVLQATYHLEKVADRLKRTIPSRPVP